MTMYDNVNGIDTMSPYVAGAAISAGADLRDLLAHRMSELGRALIASGKNRDYGELNNAMSEVDLLRDDILDCLEEIKDALEEEGLGWQKGGL